MRITEFDYKGADGIVVMGCSDCDEFSPAIPYEHFRKRKGNFGCLECGNKRSNVKGQEFTTDQ